MEEHAEHTNAIEVQGEFEMGESSEETKRKMKVFNGKGNWNNLFLPHYQCISDCLWPTFLIF
ncbi:MAG: hypothetical protein U5L09_20220 [Bacteroidales bacterium]|nr:hypothetical protein [Bacteroidales bacterium]